MRLLQIFDLRLVKAHSSLTGLSLSRCEQALHFVRLHRTVPKQASAAANNDSDTSMLFCGSQRDCHHGPTPSSNPRSLPAPIPDATELLPAPPHASQQSAATTATTDDDADDGMTPEPLAQATTPPTEERGDPSAPADPDPVAPAVNDAIPVCPPVAAAAANRANVAAPEDPEAAPGPVITPDAVADRPGYILTAADRLPGCRHR